MACPCIWMIAEADKPFARHTEAPGPTWPHTSSNPISELLGTTRAKHPLLLRTTLASPPKWR